MMQLLSGHLLPLAIFITLLGSAILTHELGHFLAAKLVRVRIQEFGLGLPPRLIRLGVLGETEISLNWLPLGGFVRPAGEFDPSVRDGLAASPVAARLLVLLAGSAANLVLAFVILTAGLLIGWPDQVKVAEVADGSPAQHAGLLPGDVVLRANGVEVHDTIGLHGLIHGSLGERMTFDILRDDQAASLEVTPRKAWPEGQGPAGFTTAALLARYDAIRAPGRAARLMADLISTMTRYPAELLRGEAGAGSVRLSGPIGMKQISDRAVGNALELNQIFPVLYVGAWISVALAITNLLPLPALDGGRVAFALLGALRGRGVNQRLEKLVHAMGMVALLTLLLVLTARDLAEPLF